MVIESKTNKLISHIKKIQTKKYSIIYNECFLETEKIILERIKNIKTILINNNVASKYASIVENFTGNIYYVNPSVCEYISQASNPGEIFAIIDIKNPAKQSNRFLVLDNLQDPNNVGAIIRSALAFGFNKIYAINSVYPYLFKTIRSSMGYVFDIDYEVLTKDEFIKISSANNFKLYCADMLGKDITQFKNKYDRFGICIGNEGNGVSDEIRNACFETLSIPMLNNVESLNASVSASVLMFNLIN